MRYIASISFGKDSLAMLLKLIDGGYPLDEIVFFDTGMEFQAIYNLRDVVKPILNQHGIQFTELKPKKPFLYSMFEAPIKYRNQPGFHCGMEWCGGTCRWGTCEKLKAIRKHCKGAIQYVGIAADEPARFEKQPHPLKRMPLIDWGMTEADCLALCYEKGFNWIEDEVDLYDLLDRVSCWCCSNKNLKELRNIYHRLPRYWEKLKNLQRRLKRPMKGFYKGQPQGVFELEKRFQFEDIWIQEGRSITRKPFYIALEKHIRGVEHDEKTLNL